MWTCLDKETAETHRLYGLRGWLLVVLILWGVGIPFQVMNIFIARMSGYEILATVTGTALGIFAIVLAIQRDPRFQEAAVLGTLVNFLFFGLPAVLAQSSTQNMPVLFSLIMGAFGLAIVAVTVCYLMFSRRVNITFRHRIHNRPNFEAPDVSVPMGARA